MGVWSVVGLGVAAAGLAVLALRLQQQLTRQEELRKAERQGRIRAEKKLADSSRSEQKDSSGIKFHPIGTVSSPFAKRLGTPRQPSLVHAAHSVIELHHALEAGLDSLENFSHIWVVFVFHGNTNMAKRKNAIRPFDGLKLLVEPPKARGKKVGVLACRTPHRPNPIGLSLCKLEKIEKTKLHVSGLDCLDGTPVIDIKPYLPLIECVPNAIVPEWIYQGVDDDRKVSVEWGCDRNNVPDALLIEQTLSRDIRSRNQIEIGEAMRGVWQGELVLKGARVIYTVDKQKVARIQKIVSLE